MVRAGLLSGTACLQGPHTVMVLSKEKSSLTVMLPTPHRLQETGWCRVQPCSKLRVEVSPPPLLCQSECRVKCKCELILLIFFNVLELGNPALGFSFSEYEKRKRLLFSSLKSNFSTAIVKRDKEKAWHGCSLVVQWLGFGAFTVVAWVQPLVREHPASRVTWSKKKKRARERSWHWDNNEVAGNSVSSLKTDHRISSGRLEAFSVDGRHNQLTGWWDIPLTAPIFLS